MIPSLRQCNTKVGRALYLNNVEENENGIVLPHICLVDESSACVNDALQDRPGFQGTFATPCTRPCAVSCPFSPVLIRDLSLSLSARASFLFCTLWYLIVRRRTQSAMQRIFQMTRRIRRVDDTPGRIGVHERRVLNKNTKIRYFSENRAFYTTWVAVAWSDCLRNARQFDKNLRRDTREREREMRFAGLFKLQARSHVKAIVTYAII